ncbi:MAG: UvrB/UvrC motif-containing protein [Verrucomicrobia bacterium]|nr:UvrB/UvrC motif-containing protein [Verrucomicrobiota bacterium]
MSYDISRLLDQWSYEPGRVVVRRFEGKDGEEKIQLRVDLGILQMNAHGRPDGKRPLGHASLFEFYLDRFNARRKKAAGDDGDFVLGAEECAKLQLEVLQYHHRSICFLELQDFSAAVRDTERNLKVLDFVDEYAETDELAWSLQQFRPQIIMLYTRAKATRHMQSNRFRAAIDQIEESLEELRTFFEDYGRQDLLEHSPELFSLEQWRGELDQSRPLTRRERLELDLADAVKREDYEKAARVRDALRKLPAPE